MVSGFARTKRVENGSDKSRLTSMSSRSIQKALPAPPPKMMNNPDASYLITGGTGGIGRSITRRLALGVTVFVDCCDVADPAQIQAHITKSQQSRRPTRGVIHGPMALRDALFENITHGDWQMNIFPRMRGAWNLHCSLQYTPLDFFVVLSSICGIVGNPG
ncbi:MAG: hypothetical protein Q9204_004398 [Flavoplaca sp. TL-2023a]